MTVFPALTPGQLFSAFQFQTDGLWIQLPDQPAAKLGQDPSLADGLATQWAQSGLSQRASGKFVPCVMADRAFVDGERLNPVFMDCRPDQPSGWAMAAGEFFFESLTEWHQIGRVLNVHVQETNQPDIYRMAHFSSGVRSFNSGFRVFHHFAGNYLETHVRVELNHLPEVLLPFIGEHLQEIAPLQMLLGCIQTIVNWERQDKPQSFRADFCYKDKGRNQTHRFATNGKETWFNYSRQVGDIHALRPDHMILSSDTTIEGQPSLFFVYDQDRQATLFVQRRRIDEECPMWMQAISAGGLFLLRQEMKSLGLTINIPVLDRIA